MSITIFSNPHVPASNETVQKFVSSGIAFGVRSPQRDMESVRAARVSVYPTVCAVTAAGHVRWEGHQPKLIELLIDLLETGPAAEKKPLSVAPDRGTHQVSPTQAI